MQNKIVLLSKNYYFLSLRFKITLLEEALRLKQASIAQYNNVLQLFTKDSQKKALPFYCIEINRYILNKRVFAHPAGYYNFVIYLLK